MSRTKPGLRAAEKLNEAEWRGQLQPRGSQIQERVYLKGMGGRLC